MSTIEFSLDTEDWKVQEFYFMLHDGALQYYTGYPIGIAEVQSPRGVFKLGEESAIERINHETCEFAFKLVVDKSNSTLLCAKDHSEMMPWLRKLYDCIRNFKKSSDLQEELPKRHVKSRDINYSQVYMVPEKDVSRSSAILGDKAQRKKFVQKKKRFQSSEEPGEMEGSTEVWRRLFAWGSSSHGQLCSALLSKSGEPELIKGAKRRLQAKAIQLGDTYGAMITEKRSEVFVWGRSPIDQGKVRFNSPQLVSLSASYIKHSTDVCSFQVRTLSEKKVIQISCGSNHMAAITDINELFTWGKGLKGELGLGKLVTAADEPMKVHLPYPVVSVDCGTEHTLLIVSKDTPHTAVFACGAHSFGKLGLLGSNEDIHFPVEIDLLDREKIIHVSAGKCSSLAASKHKVYHWGKIGYHQNVLPTILETFPRSAIKQIEAGDNIGMVLCEKYGETTLYSYGGAMHLLANGSEDVCQELQPIEVLQKHFLTQVSIGKKHAAALAVDGTLFTWGSNQCGQLGTGHTASLAYPYETIRVLSYKYSSVSCGGNTTAAIADYKDHSEESDLWELKYPPSPPQSYETMIRTSSRARLPTLLVKTLRKMRN